MKIGWTAGAKWRGRWKRKMEEGNRPADGGRTAEKAEEGAVYEESA